jgi:hypothetical protein
METDCYVIVGNDFIGRENKILEKYVEKMSFRDLIDL